MVSVEKALRTILINVKTLNSETAKLTDSLDRVTAKDIHSDIDIPAFDNSAMDGYAVRSCDTTGASKDKPKVLEVIDEIKAGVMPKKALKKRAAMRIMTGAPMPKGADSVVIVEHTKKPAKESVEIYKQAKIGENVRKTGEDIKRGELVMPKGTLLKPSLVGILASLGMARVEVTRRPKIAILSTGDEMVDVRGKLELGKVRSSNTYTLYGQVLKYGGIPKNLGIAGDNTRQLEKRIARGLDCDMILTSGGVSVGDYDLVKPVLAKMGTDIKFWKVAMRPGKPLAFGRLGKVLVFALPGNPVSSMVSFEIFVRPAILKMLGTREDCLKGIDAVLEERIIKRKGARYFLRAKTRWENSAFFTRTTGAQGSGILKSMALANSLIILPEDCESAEKGEKVKIRFLG